MAGSFSEGLLFKTYFFLSKLLFQSLYFLKVLTYILSQELLFQRTQFFRTTNFQQLTSWSFQILKYPEGGVRGEGEGGVTEWCTTQKIFPLNTMTKTFTSKLLSQGHIEQNKLSTNAKKFRFGGFNKNINFRSKFQYWIGWKTNNLRLVISHCNISF